MSEGYCTIEDVRRALRERNLPGDIDQDKQIAVDAITAQTEWAEKSLSRHWYEPNGISEAFEITIPTSTKERDDEEDIPTSPAFVVGEGVEPKTSQGTYTGIELARRDAASVTKLMVRDGDGGYTDWVSSSDYDGGTWPSALGDDYYLRINSSGVSVLYLDTESLKDDNGEFVLDSYSKAVYVTFEYGHEGIPQTFRNAIALRAAARFVDEAAIQIPDSARIRSVDSKAEEMREEAADLLEVYR